MAKLQRPAVRGKPKPRLIGVVDSSGTAEMHLVYIGTYTGESSKGIYTCRFDEDTGELTSLELATEIVNPTYLALHPKRRLLYA